LLSKFKDNPGLIFTFYFYPLFLQHYQSFRFSKDVEDIIVLLDGYVTLEQDYNSAQPKLKQYINHWFGANVEDLIEATYISCPSKDIEREDFIIELIERIAE
jgi:hypothetical protein